MFENIVGQANVVPLLKNSFENHQVPRAMLFYGPRFTGKLSVALECARFLTCQYGVSECSCSDCTQQKGLLHPHTVFLGNRYFDSEISLTSQVFLKNSKKEFYVLFIESIRKLLRRFDSFLWDNEDQRYRKAYPVFVQLKEKLFSFIFIPNDTMNKKSKLVVIELVKLSITLAEVLKDYTVSVKQVHNLRQWCLNTSWITRIVIIEQADRMNESSCNALLKFLEEPQSGLYFILIATSKIAILPTILSRLRTYTFVEQSSSELQIISQQIFGQKADSIQSYIQLEYLFAGISEKELHTLVENFYHGMQNGKSFIDAYPGILIKDQDKAEEHSKTEKHFEIEKHFELFLCEISYLISSKWREGKIPYYLANEQIRGLSLLKSRFFEYRQSPQNLLEKFFLTFWGIKY